MENLELNLENLSINDNTILEQKNFIIELFDKNVKNKEIDLSSYNKKDKGAEGRWLEKQLGLRHNNRNEPDILNFELKKLSKQITFGDFSASEYLFSKNKKFINNSINIERENFIKYFGNSVNNRYSWSGKCVPILNKYNENGQILKILKNNDICIYYSYSEDKRITKTSIIPDFLRNDNILIVIWKNEKMKKFINNKFNQNGFVICSKNKKNCYDTITFGKPFDFDYFIEEFKKNNIYFDSGMYSGNNRNYSMFRAYFKNFWIKLLF